MRIWLNYVPSMRYRKKGFIVCVYRHAMRRTMRAIRYRLGQRVRRELTMRERAHADIDWV